MVCLDQTVDFSKKMQDMLCALPLSAVETAMKDTERVVSL